MNQMRILGFMGASLLLACGGNLDVDRDDNSDDGGNTGGTSAGAGPSGRAGAEAEGGRHSFGGTESVAGSSPQGGAKPYGGQDFGGTNSMGAASGDTGRGGAKLTAGSGGAFEPPPLPEWPPEEEELEESVLTGVWEGHTIDFLLRPIEKFRVEIAGVNADGVLRGTVTVGEGDLIEPATDPDAAYPPGSEVSHLPMKGVSELVDGATYTITDGVHRDLTVRFQIDANELMRGWCELQTSYQLPEGPYHCLPNGGWSSSEDTCMVTDETGKEHTFPVAKCWQCMSSCTCAPGGCTARQDYVQRFDLRWDSTADSLIGTLAGTDIELTKVE